MLADKEQPTGQERTINKKNHAGMTALVFAFFCLKVPKKLAGTVSHLLRASADPNIPDSEGLLPIFLALKSGNNK